jgi:transposase
MAHLFWLSDKAWEAIEPHLPRGLPGKPRVDDRRVISGILHVLKTGCRWRDVPAAYGPPTTIYNRFTRWSYRGIWQRMFERLAAAGPVPEELCLDSTHVKAHRSAQNTKGGPGRKRAGSRAAGRPARSMHWPMRHKPTGRVCPDTRKHPGHSYGYSASGGTFPSQEADCRQGLRCHEPTSLAQALAHQSGDPLPGHTHLSLPARSKSIQAAQRHRADVGKAQELAPYRDPIRPSCP